jgi:hypothetical protein
LKIKENEASSMATKAEKCHKVQGLGHRKSTHESPTGY